MKESIKLETFKGYNFSEVRLPVFTVYERPSDFPNEYIVRLFDIEKPTPYYVSADTKEGAVSKMPDGLTQMPVFENDDPVIVGVFL